MWNFESVWMIFALLCILLILFHSQLADNSVGMKSTFYPAIVDLSFVGVTKMERSEEILSEKYVFQFYILK